MASLKWARRFMVLGIVVPLSSVVITTTPATMAAAASGSGATSVNIADEYGVPWNCQFNPFNASDEFDSFGPVYEELVYVELPEKRGDNAVAGHRLGVVSNGNKTLTFTIRKGVTWTDGQPFSANDVVFTFNLLKKNPALDLNSDWSVLTSVAGQGYRPGCLQLQRPRPYRISITSPTRHPIVPAHIWSTVKDPVTFLDPHPIGTGGYVMSSCSGANIQYTKNHHYWQPGLAENRDRQFPVLPLQQCGQPGPEERDRPMGLPVHPQYPAVLHFERPEVLPLLVRAGLQRVALAQPD